MESEVARQKSVGLAFYVAGKGKKRKQKKEAVG